MEKMSFLLIMVFLRWFLAGFRNVSEHSGPCGAGEFLVMILLQC